LNIKQCTTGKKNILDLKVEMKLVLTVSKIKSF